MPACPVLSVFPAADVPAAVFVPAFAAVDRVFVRAAATAVVVSVEAAVVFARAAVVAFARLRVVFDRPAAASDRPETVVSVRPAAVFAHSNCFVPASDAAGLAAISVSDDSLSSQKAPSLRRRSMDKQSSAAHPPAWHQ